MSPLPIKVIQLEPTTKLQLCAYFSHKRPIQIQGHQQLHFKAVIHSGPFQASHAAPSDPLPSFEHSVSMFAVQRLLLPWLHVTHFGDKKLPSQLAMSFKVEITHELLFHASFSL
ncbi:MAG: hypothetical protein EOP36_03085 [Rubrivivax sp.]|nr:MAG: hypothetical protein EOP36_03085 [Rubrivivax sp.]